MKKLICLVAAVLVMLMAAVTASAECESAQQAVDNINVGWNLGNTFDCKGDWISGGVKAYETAWGNPEVTQQLIKGVKAAGFGAIRLPVTWDAHIDSKGNIDKEWLDRVQQVVDYILDEGLYCVLNVHHDGGSDGWLVASSENVSGSVGTRFKGLWTNIAERFKDYDERLIFESFNEVLDSNTSWTSSTTKDGYSAVNQLNQIFVDAVRAVGGNNSTRNLMVQTYSAGSSDITLRSFVLPKDTVDGHLIVQVHSYDPQGFTYTEAAWTTMTDKWGSNDQIAVVEKLFKALHDYSDSLGVPFVVGEFGAQSKNNDADRAQYAALMVSEGAKTGVKCFWWDNGADFKIIDRTTGTVTCSEIVNALVDNAQSGVSGDAVLCGDANGDGKINSADASAILKYSVGIGTVDINAADFNGDGRVNAADASAVLRYCVGL